MRLIYSLVATDMIYYHLTFIILLGGSSEWGVWCVLRHLWCHPCLVHLIQSICFIVIFYWYLLILCGRTTLIAYALISVLAMELRLSEWESSTKIWI